MDNPPSSLLKSIGLLILLWITGLYLRIPILVAPPLEPKISADLGLDQAAAGTLTTLPILMLSLGAVLGSLVIARLGVRHAVAAGLTLAAAASAARGIAPPVFVLFAATVFMGLGVAIMQPAMPALAAVWQPRFTALAIGVYMNGMYTGEFLSAGTTQLFVAPLAGGDWRWTLVLWSTPVIAIVAALYIPSANARTPKSNPVAVWPDWRNPAMWRLGLLLSATSVLFMGTNAYMADVLKSQGEAQALQPGLFWFNLSQIVASLIMIALAQRLVMRRAPLIATSLASTIAGVCFVFFGGLISLGCAFVLGMATAMQLTLVVMAAPYTAPPGEAGRTSAGIFVIGYSIAFVVPLLGGMFAEAVHTPWMAMLPMLAYAAATLPLALTLHLPVYRAP